MASILKGGKTLIKGSAPGLAVAAVAHLAGAEGRRAFLTITTDKQIHTLVGTGGGGQRDVGLALEAAGNSLLAVGGVPPSSPGEQRVDVHHQEAGPPVVSSAPSLASRLRELSELHKDGVLSDEEFAAAKATLLSNL